jgi:hypothetical protein
MSGLEARTSYGVARFNGSNCVAPDPLCGMVEDRVNESNEPVPGLLNFGRRPLHTARLRGESVPQPIALLGRESRYRPLDLFEG